MCVVLWEPITKLRKTCRVLSVHQYWIERKFSTFKIFPLFSFHSISFFRSLEKVANATDTSCKFQQCSWKEFHCIFIFYFHVYFIFFTALIKWLTQLIQCYKYQQESCKWWHVFLLCQSLKFRIAEFIGHLISAENGCEWNLSTQMYMVDSRCSTLILDEWCDFFLYHTIVSRPTS